MRLVDALGLRRREIVALVGAGGKTSAMFLAADELRAAAAPAVVTTTTKIYAPPSDGGLCLVTGEVCGALVTRAAEAVARGETPVVGRSVSAEGKLVGILPEWVPGLADLAGGAVVLVEADGARHLPITAPREHEPVIPPAATVVVAVVGIDALGARIADVAHHPDLVCALTGLTPRDVLDATAIRRVVLGAAGNVKGAPRGARVVAVVNKADDPARVSAARSLARELRGAGAERVVVTALASGRVVEVVG